MGKVMTQQEREVQEWKKRVFFDVKFKENTDADLKKLNQVMKKFMEKFTILSSPTEVCVYKIGRYFVDNGMSNQQITFWDGRIVSAYISTKDPNDWSKRRLIDNLIDIYKKDIRGKVLFIPILENEWDSLTALYFTTQLQYVGALGLVFFAAGPNNLAEILIQGSDIAVMEFPKVVWGEKRVELVDDEW